MIKAELGQKRRCLGCNAAFFDLNRTPIVCPRCSDVFQVVEPIRSSPGRIAAFQNRAKWRSPQAEAQTNAIIPESEDVEADVVPSTDEGENPEVETIEEIA
jgi:uncharacterized protein (TIGR02300 family)